MLGDESCAIFGEALRKVLSSRSIEKPRVMIWSEKTTGHAAAMSTEVDIEPLSRGPELGSWTEVPFSCKAGFISCPFECFREGLLGKVHPVVKKRRQEGPASSPREKVRGVGARGMTACHYGISGRRADRIGGISIGKTASRLSNAVAIWRLVEGVWVVGPNVHIPQIVYEEKDDIWALRSGRERYKSLQDKEKAEHVCDESPWHAMDSFMRGWGWQGRTGISCPPFFKSFAFVI